MTDWKLLAEAQHLDIPADELGRVTAPLAALEAAIQALTADLRPELEPAVVFDPSPETSA
jgi:5'-3' exonuclease